MQGHLLAVVLTFLVSLTAFPGISSAICSIRNGATVAPCLATSPSGRIFGTPPMQNLCTLSFELEHCFEHYDNSFTMNGEFDRQAIF